MIDKILYGVRKEKLNQYIDCLELALVGAGCPILARLFAQGWDSTVAALSGFYLSHMTENQETSRLSPCLEMHLRSCTKRACRSFSGPTPEEYQPSTHAIPLAADTSSKNFPEPAL